MKFAIDRRPLAAAALVLLGTAAPAFAQDAAPAQSGSGQSERDAMAADMGKDHITVGVGGAYVPDYEGSNDYRLVPGPVVIGSVGGFNFSVLGNRASVDLIPNRPGQSLDLQFGPIGVLNFNRSSPSNIDDARVRALGKVKTAVELGGYVGIGKTGVLTSPYDKLSLSVSYRHDVGNVHKSGIWEPSLTYLAPVSTKAAIGLNASGQYAETGYAQTYFGITPAQSLASGLPSYNARKGWKSYSVGALATYSLTGNLLHGVKLIAGGTYTRLLGDFSYSPVVRIAGSPNQWIGAVGVAYTF